MFKTIALCASLLAPLAASSFAIAGETQADPTPAAVQSAPSAAQTKSTKQVKTGKATNGVKGGVKSSTHQGRKGGRSATSKRSHVKSARAAK